MSNQLANALRVLAEAMRDDEHDTPEAGDEDEREVTANSVPRPMGYFSKPSAKVTQQRATNAADPDAPLTMRAVLLAPPDKKAAA